MRRLACLTLSFLAATALAASQGSAAPSFTTLDVPQPDRRAHPTAISGDGTRVVGYLEAGNNTIGAAWDVTGAVTPLGDIPGGTMEGVSNATNHDGSIVVGTGTSDLRNEEGVMWDASNALNRIHHAASNANDWANTRANAISGDGTTVVGDGRAHLDSYGSYHAVRWNENGDVVSLLPKPADETRSGARDVSHDGSKVVGWYNDTDHFTRAFVWDQTTGMQALEPVPGLPDVETMAVAISGDGTKILGHTNQSGVYTRAWIRDENGMQILPTVDGSGTSFTPGDMSADGSRVVGHGYTGGGYGAVVWTEGYGTVPLQQMLATLGIDTTGWDLRYIGAISDDGRTIAGTAYDPGGSLRGFVAVIPEPGTELLVSAGLGAIALRRRGRRLHRY